jgi:hypothetical protein
MTNAYEGVRVRITRGVDERGQDRMGATSACVPAEGVGRKEEGRSFSSSVATHIRRDFDPQFVSIVFSSCGDGM